MFDNDLLVVEQLHNKDRIALFLLDDNSNAKIANCQYRDIFIKTFKLFFPSKKKNHSCVNQKDELKKYKLIANDLKNDCDAMNNFLIGFGKFFRTPELDEIKAGTIIAARAPEPDETKTGAGAPRFSKILNSLALYGKSIAKNSCLKDEFDIEIEEEYVVNENQIVAHNDSRICLCKRKTYNDEKTGHPRKSFISHSNKSHRF